MTGHRSLSRTEKLHRVLLLCGSFVRNLAYFRVGCGEEHKHLLSMDNENFNFWRMVNGNFIDMCVLDWCKLFGERKGEYCWKNIVTDAASFKIDLLLHLGLDEEAFNKEIHIMREYRDKWVAHLDLEQTGFRPMLDVAKKSIWFYYAHIMKHEAESAYLVEFGPDLDRGYEYSEREANAVYRTAASTVPKPHSHESRQGGSGPRHIRTPD